jgi:hypothetical protein
VEKRVEKSADGGVEILSKVGEMIGLIAVGWGKNLARHVQQKRKRFRFTLFLLSPKDIVIPRDKASDFYATFKADNSGQTPAKEHSEFMRTSKSSIFTP